MRTSTRLACAMSCATLVAMCSLTTHAEPDAAQSERVGGACRYVDHPGTCTIDNVERAADSIAQASLNGGPGYEGLRVTFSYVATDPSDDPLVQRTLNERHELRLVNSWYPGPRFLARYSIPAGKSFACTLSVIAEGTCTPLTFDFPAIDRTDYFESAH